MGKIEELEARLRILEERIRKIEEEREAEAEWAVTFAKSVFENAEVLDYGPNFVMFAADLGFAQVVVKIVFAGDESVMTLTVYKGDEELDTIKLKYHSMLVGPRDVRRLITYYAKKLVEIHSK